MSLHYQDAGSSGSMKLKQLKSLIDEQAPSVLSKFSSRKDAIAYLKLKVIYLIFAHIILDLVK